MKVRFLRLCFSKRRLKKMSDLICGIKIDLKKMLAVFMTVAVVFTFSGCNGEETPEEDPEAEATVAVTDKYGEAVTDESGNPVFKPVETVAVTDENGSPVTDESGEPVYEVVEEEKVVYKVGFVYSGKATDGANNAVFEDARHKIEKTLGLETCYVEDVLVADFPEAVEVLKKEECNIIVSCSPKFAHSASKESQLADGTYYLAFGGTSNNGRLAGFGGELYQTAAVCGIAAAHNTKSNVIGVVADPGSYNAYGVIDGFIIGASELWGVYTDVRVNWVWSNDEAATDRAIDDLIDQGCDIIMAYMESDHAVEYLADKDVGVIANTCNISEVAPDNFLTGYFFNFGTYLIDQVRAISNDFFVSKVYSGGIAEGVSRLADFGSRCSEGTQTICETYAVYIRDRKALVFQGELKNNKGKIVIEKGQALSFDNIQKINWLVQGARRVKDFTDVTQNPISSTFQVKS